MYVHVHFSASSIFAYAKKLDVPFSCTGILPTFTPLKPYVQYIFKCEQFFRIANLKPVICEQLGARDHTKAKARAGGKRRVAVPIGTRNF